MLCCVGGGEGDEPTGHASRPVPRVGAHDARRAGGVPRAGAFLALFRARALQRYAQRARHSVALAGSQQGPHYGQLLHFFSNLQRNCYCPGCDR